MASLIGFARMTRPRATEVVSVAVEGRDCTFSLCIRGSQPFPDHGPRPPFRIY